MPPSPREGRGAAPSSATLLAAAASLALGCLLALRLSATYGRWPMLHRGSSLPPGGGGGGGGDNDANVAAAQALLAAWPAGKPKACIVILARNRCVGGPGPPCRRGHAQPANLNNGGRLPPLRSHTPASCPPTVDAAADARPQRPGGRAQQRDAV